MWLAELPGARVLFDPLLEPTFHGGVFRVHPAREIDEAALRADLIVVTHRHPDHFDVPSLRRLAARDPSAVVITSDAWVGRVCQRLGFADVCVVGPWEAIPLDGGALLPTPSHAEVVEWGMIVASAEGTCWNQVDSALGDLPTVRATLARAADALGRPRLADGPDLAIVRWQPLREVEPHVYGQLGFPAELYARELDRVAATGARHVVPGAAGHHYVGEAAWLNALAHPVPEARFLRDLAARCPGVVGHAGRVGATFSIVGGEVAVDPSPSPLARPVAAADDRAFDPLALPPLVDPRDRTDEDRALVHTWVEEVLPAAVARLGAALPGGRLVLDVVWRDRVDAWTLHLPPAPRLERRHEPDWDVLNRVAGSDLARVLRGEEHWGNPLLAGRLRSARRAYRVGPEGLVPARVPVFFLYLALPYERAFERWVEHLLAAG